MKKIFVTVLAIMLSVSGMAGRKPTVGLSFDASKGVAGSVTTPQGRRVNYTAFTHLYYVTQVEDSAYQYLNLFVPEGATQSTPIFMHNYVGGYMAAEARFPDAEDASGRALAEGYVVAIPGVRGRNSVRTRPDGTSLYTGRAPKAILDLKAAVRYLRLFDREMPGDAERIITCGTSAGGAMSALQGATANDPVYEPYLRDMGAADTRDDIFAAVCYCPIIDLDHADMAYEWLYGGVHAERRLDTPERQRVSRELAAQFPAYLESLGLADEEGNALTADNYLAYIKRLLIRSAQEAKDAGADLPDSLGLTFSGTGGFAPPMNGRPAMGQEPGRGAAPGGKERRNFMPRGRRVGEYVLDLDMETYLNYVASTVELKPCPSFDNRQVAGQRGTGENEEFGDDTGSSVNYTDYALQQATGNPQARVDEELRQRVRMLNPMPFIRPDNGWVAPHWYIRHGARDRDTAFPIPINLALKLRQAGRDVDFKLPWNRPHSGDYALDDLFGWMARKVAEAAN